MANTKVAINLEASVSGAEQVKKLKEDIKAASKEAEKVAKEFGASSEQAQKAADKVAKLNTELGGFKTIKQQIKEATQEAILLAQKFGEFSPEATAAAQKVAGLKDQMGDFQQRVEALNPDKFQAIGKLVGGVTSGISAAQGAMALFGGESEELQKSLLKVQGAMALAQGTQGLIDSSKQFQAFGQAAVGAFKAMTTASKVFLATGLGLIIAAIGYAVANFDELAQAMGFAESEMQKMNKAMDIAAAQTQQQAADLEYYNSVVQDTKKSEGEREFALQKLKEAGIATDDVNIANANSLGALNDRTKQQIILIAQKARTDAAAQILQEKTKKLIEMQNGGLDEQITLWDRFAEAAKSAITSGIYQQDLQGRANENVKKSQDEVNDATKLYQTEREKSLKLDGVAISTSKQVASTMKKQKDATKDLKQAELERIAEVLSLDKSTLEKQIAAADAAFAVTVKGLREKGLTEKQINQKRDAELEKIRTDFYAKEKADAEKAAADAATLKKQQQDSLLKANEAYFKAEETKLIERNASQAEFDALELQRLKTNLEGQKAINGEFSAEAINAENDLAKKKKDIYDKDQKAKEDAEKAKVAAQISSLESASSIIGSLGQLFGESEKSQKGFALAQIAVDTAKALTAAQANAMSPTVDNIATGGISGFAKYAAYVGIILSNVARARSIIKGSGGGGAGGAAGVPAAPSFTPTAGGALPEEGQFGGMGRVYVLEGDITKTQTRVRRLRNTSVV